MTCHPERNLDTLIARYPELESVRADILAAYECLAASYDAGGKLLIGGNGGSAADASHIVGELVKSFCLPRPMDEAFRQRAEAADPQLGPILGRKLQQGLPAIALSAHTALTSAWVNDADPDLVYAQQVAVYGREGDVLLAISTSGQSTNLVYAAVAARARQMSVVALTGQGGGRLAACSDISIRVPRTQTYQVQELHLPVYHCLCLMLEERFFG